jgi:hypothetical protein
MSQKNRRRRAGPSDAVDLFPPVVRCPVCRGPRQARLGRLGPYFHCQCVAVERHAKPQAAQVRLEKFAALRHEPPAGAGRAPVPRLAHSL